MYMKKATSLENINIFISSAAGRFDIPAVKGVKQLPDLDWVGFNYARSMSGSRKNNGIMFYLDDYQFSVVWNNPKRYISVMQRFGAVMSPDFSMYTNMPIALQLYNHYRRMWCAAYWEANGIKVVPCICWSDERSFDFCFCGQPQGGIVSVSTVGTQRYAESRENFSRGYEKMVEILSPQKVLIYGKILDFMGDEAVSIGCFTDKFKVLTK